MTESAPKRPGEDSADDAEVSPFFVHPQGGELRLGRIARFPEPMPPDGDREEDPGAIAGAESTPIDPKYMYTVEIGNQTFHWSEFPRSARRIDTDSLTYRALAERDLQIARLHDDPDGIAADALAEAGKPLDASKIQRSLVDLNLLSTGKAKNWWKTHQRAIARSPAIKKDGRTYSFVPTDERGESEQKEPAAESPPDVTAALERLSAPKAGGRDKQELIGEVVAARDAGRLSATQLSWATLLGLPGFETDPDWDNLDPGDLRKRGVEMHLERAFDDGCFVAAGRLALEPKQPGALRKAQQLASLHDVDSEMRDALAQIVRVWATEIGSSTGKDLGSLLEAHSRRIAAVDELAPCPRGPELLAAQIDLLFSVAVTETTSEAGGLLVDWVADTIEDDTTHRESLSAAMEKIADERCSRYLSDVVRRLGFDHDEARFRLLEALAVGTRSGSLDDVDVWHALPDRGLLGRGMSGVLRDWLGNDRLTTGVVDPAIERMIESEQPDDVIWVLTAPATVQERIESGRFVESVREVAEKGGAETHLLRFLSASQSEIRDRDARVAALESELERANGEVQAERKRSGELEERLRKALGSSHAARQDELELARTDAQRAIAEMLRLATQFEQLEGGSEIVDRLRAVARDVHVVALDEFDAVVDFDPRRHRLVPDIDDTPARVRVLEPGYGVEERPVPPLVYGLVEPM